MGGGGKKGGDQVIGYEYYLGVDFSWCHGPADRFTGFYIDDRSIYEGCLQDQDTIVINERELFGDIEGGVAGRIDAEFGALDQAKNTYTVSQTGSDTPAYRGVTRTVWRGKSEDGSSRSFYFGNNPYIKRVTGELQRIYKRIRDGAVVDNWQNSIAGIPLIDPDPDGLGFSTGVVADQSLFINVDLSSASNGWAGYDETIQGNGLGVASVRQAIVNSLLDIRDKLTWETEPTETFTGTENNDSGLDIGIGYVRFTGGSQNNTSNNPNDVDPRAAPTREGVGGTVGISGGSWDLPERGWIMKENATRADIDDLIEFVNEFVVVPDTRVSPNRNLMELLYNNLNEAYNTLSSGNNNLRGHIVYSGFATDENRDEAGDYNDLIEALLTETGSSTDHPTKAVYGPALSQYNGTRVPDDFGDNSDGNTSVLDNLISPVGTPGAGRWEITAGGWYLIARQANVQEGDFRQAGNTGFSQYEVGDTVLVDNPAGGPINAEPLSYPDESWGLWYFGPYKDGGIYATRFNIVEHWQRDNNDEPTEISINRDGEQQVFQPLNDFGSKFTESPTGTADGTSPGMYIIDICSGYVEMNPAHIIRECLTDQQWGLGLPEADIDETSFAAAAQTLYDELFGLSIAWTRETPIEDFINVILNHIDAVLYVSRNDGLWHLVLIRDDYDPDALDTYTDADVVDWTEIAIKSPAELVNSVTVKYNNRGLDGPASLTVNNLAQIQKLGKIIPTTVNYPGIWQDTLATRVGQRDLITLSTSLIAGEVVLTRKAYDLAPGDVFKLSSSRYNLSGEVMRVVEVNVGDGRQNGVRVKFTQDKYNFDFSEETDLVAPSDPIGEPIGIDPAAVDDRIVTEQPYYLFVQREGEILAEEIETKEKDIGYPFIVANPPTESSKYSRIRYDDGGGYINGGQVSYGTYATLNAELLQQADDTTVTLSNTKFLTDASVNDLIQIEDEIMRIDSIDSSTQITVARGALDTVPEYHRKGLTVFFLDNSNYIRGEYVASDTFDIKLLDNTTSGQLDEALAFVDSLTLDSRITSPYPVGKLQLDGSYTGLWSYDTGSTVEATWVHRDRTQQNTTTPPVHVDSGVGPETSVNYTISAVAYDMNGDELTSIGDLFSTDKNQNTSETINTDSYNPTSEGTDPWSAVGVRVLTQREDSTSVIYDNWQTPEVIAYTQLEPNDLADYYSAGWVDANDVTSLWQDYAQTTDTTSDGDPVGYANNQKDKFS